MAIRDTVNRLISDVYEGKLHPRIAAGLAPLMHLQLRVVEKTGIERRWPNWNGSSKSSWTRIGRIVTNSVTKRSGSENVEPYAMKTARSSEIMASHGLRVIAASPLRLKSKKFVLDFVQPGCTITRVRSKTDSKSASWKWNGGCRYWSKRARQYLDEQKTRKVLRDEKPSRHTPHLTGLPIAPIIASVAERQVSTASPDG
jgi:hypothetical protein